jgi:hypothetical protein
MRLPRFARNDLEVKLPSCNRDDINERLIRSAHNDRDVKRLHSTRMNTHRRAACSIRNEIKLVHSGTRLNLE